MGYREDDEATLRKRDALARALEAGDASVASEIAAIDAARIETARRRVPAIARARVASPCGERWDTMLGDGAVRSCSRCEKEVFDLSRMTLGQAEALVTRHAGHGLCARLHVRADGTMMFADCEVGASGVAKRRLAIAGAAILASSAALAWAQPPPASTPEAPPARASVAALRSAGEAFLGPTPDDLRWYRENAVSTRMGEIAWTSGDVIPADAPDRGTLEQVLLRGQPTDVPSADDTLARDRHPPVRVRVR